MGLQLRQGRIGFAQEKALIALQVDRPPALAVFPQLFVAAHVFRGPAEGLEFLGAAFVNLQQRQAWSLGLSVGAGLVWPENRAARRLWRGWSDRFASPQVDPDWLAMDPADSINPARSILVGEPNSGPWRKLLGL
jgi:hypothetical protein